MKTLLWQGFLRLDRYDEGDNVLFLDEDPLAELLHEEIFGEQVTARYWIANKECSREQANEAFMEQLVGVAITDFGARYSEITGYLWTNEDIKIGGHDLLDELKDNVGKYLILEIDVHDPVPIAPKPIFEDLIKGLKDVSKGADVDWVDFNLHMKVEVIKHLIQVLETQ